VKHYFHFFVAKFQLYAVTVSCYILADGKRPTLKKTLNWI